MSRFFALLGRFRRSEAGAVTVDWVVLTAGVIGLAVGIIAAWHTNTVGFADAVAEYLAAYFSEE